MKPLGWKKTGNKTHWQHGKGCPACSPMIQKEIRRSPLHPYDIYERWCGRGRAKTQFRREERRAEAETV